MEYDSDPSGAVRDNAGRIRSLIETHFTATDVAVYDRFIRFVVHDVKSPFRTIRDDFAAAGCMPLLRRRAGSRICLLVRTRRRAGTSPRRETAAAAALFVITLATTTMAGYFFSAPMVEYGFMSNVWWGSASFSSGLLFVLGCHEMGHKLAAMRCGIDASPPYFIPLPSLAMFGSEFVTLGTLGAVIRVRSPLPSDDSAVDMGLNGPIAGFLAAVPIAVLGAMLSRQIAPEHLPGRGVALYFGEPLILKGIAWLFAPRGTGAVVPHPLLFAGWVGFFVTSLNLIPVGQLDGGHVMRALVGQRRFRFLSLAIVFSLFALGFVWYGWFVWSAVGLLLTLRKYPRVMNEFEGLSRAKRRKALLAPVLFALCFMPVPIAVR
ncbi:MAG: site-2 protease family protein [bacterium]